MATVGLSSQTYRAAPVVKLRRPVVQQRKQWSAQVYVGGSLLTVTPPKRFAPGPGGVRGKCRGFSAASRRRLFRKLAMLQRDQVAAGKFVTLTYPQSYPTPTKAKEDLRAFLKRLRRHWPEAAAIWKIEPQKRGAPHFHLLVLGIKHLDKNWLSRAWYEVVGSGDERHFRAGTAVEAVRSYRGAMAYVSKYLGKEQWLDEADGEGWGRWWGIEGDLARFAALIVPLDLDRGEMARLARVLDKLRVGQVRARTLQGKRRIEALKRAKQRRSWLSRSATWMVETSILTGRLDGVIGERGVDAYVAAYLQDLEETNSLN